ncbi:MAG TPA: hypothetical protein VD926_04685 [Acidimicrobiales bacterium]|nr:hypothetical protein [Acidimicrobiales bacterium]
MRFWKVFFVVLGPLLLGLFLGVMTMVAYPSSLKVGAFLCPEDKPDAFVVRYSVSTSDGTGTNWTLYCMSERGETEEIGTWLPLLAVCAIPVGALYALVLLGLVRRLVRGMTGSGTPPPNDPTGTFLTPDQVMAPQAPEPPRFE